MEAVLKQILDKSSTVILPHFGAIIKLGEAYQFNEFLKYNDGKFITAVKEIKGISEEEATLLVSDYIRSIKEHLNSGKNYDLGELGVFTKKGERVVIAKPQQLSQPQDQEQKKSEPVTIKKEIPPITKSDEGDKAVKEEKKEAKNALPKVHTSSNLVIDKAIEKIKSIKDEKELIAFTKGETRAVVLEVIKEVALSFREARVVTKPKKAVAPAQPSTKSLQVEAEKTAEKPPVKEQQETEEKKQEQKPNEKKEKPAKTGAIDPEIEKQLLEGAIVIEKEAKKRKRNKILLWVGILFLFIGVGILGFLNKEKILGGHENTEHSQMVENHSANNKEDKQEENTQEENNEKHQEEITTEQEEDEVAGLQEEGTSETETDEQEEIVQEAVEIEAEEQEEIQEEVKPQPQGRYNIVVGSFSSEENAQNLVNTLKEKGYKNARILEKKGRLIPVSIESYTSRKEAKSALKQIEEDGYKGWVKKI